MSVLIRDMQMPENCPECRFNKESGFCSAKPPEFAGYTDDWGKPKWCPLVKLPEKHGDLIDRNSLLDGWMNLRNATKYGNQTAEQQHHSYSTLMMYEIADAVEDAPVVIEAEDSE